MRRMLPLAAALAALSLIACDDDDSSNDDTAEVRVAHLSPDAPAVDVRLDGAVVLSNVPFSTVSSYLPVDAGSHRVQVTPAGAMSPVVIDATVSLGSGRSYTVAATGLLGANDLSPLVLEDDRDAGSGNADIRFVHAGPDAPPVDIRVMGGGTLFTNIAFREDGDYITVPSGTYDLEVVVAGTSTVALAVPDVVLSSGRSYTIFAKGLLSNSSLAALPVNDSN